MGVLSKTEKSRARIENLEDTTSERIKQIKQNLAKLKRGTVNLKNSKDTLIKNRNELKKQMQNNNSEKKKLAQKQNMLDAKIRKYEALKLKVITENKKRI